MVLPLDDLQETDFFVVWTTAVTAAHHHHWNKCETCVS